LAALGLGGNLAVFALACVAVWGAGALLTRCVDVIAERRGIGRAFMGFVVLATATQLPELVTNSTAALRGDARLVLNSMFGGVSLQTAVLIGADFMGARYALTHLSRSPSNMAQATLLILLLGILLAVSVTGDVPIPGTTGLAPALLAVAYVVIVRLLWNIEQDQPWQPRVQKDDGVGDRAIANEALRRRSVGSLVGYAIASAAVILVAGVILVLSAQSIAALSGLGASFVGVTLLATATSLPELSTTLTAVRLGRHSMAVSDIFGSNLIMVGLLLPADLLYRPGPLLDHMDSSARFALTLAIVLTAVYLTGLVLRRRRRFLRLGFDSWAVLLLYAGGLAVLYHLR